MISSHELFMSEKDSVNVKYQKAMHTSKGLGISLESLGILMFPNSVWLIIFISLLLVSCNVLVVVNFVG